MTATPPRADTGAAEPVPVMAGSPDGHAAASGDLQVRLEAAEALLRTREATIAALTSELAETNQGVLALYAELDDNAEAVKELRGLIAKDKVTLLYSAHDEAHNNAVVLAAYLREAK